MRGAWRGGAWCAARRLGGAALARRLVRPRHLVALHTSLATGSGMGCGRERHFPAHTFEESSAVEVSCETMNTNEHCLRTLSTLNSTYNKRLRDRRDPTDATPRPTASASQRATGVQGARGTGGDYSDSRENRFAYFFVYTLHPRSRLTICISLTRKWPRWLPCAAMRHEKKHAADFISGR